MIAAPGAWQFNAYMLQQQAAGRVSGRSHSVPIFWYDAHPEQANALLALSYFLLNSKFTIPIYNSDFQRNLLVATAAAKQPGNYP
jgi:hypothetical protein